MPMPIHLSSSAPDRLTKCEIATVTSFGCPATGRATNSRPINRRPQTALAADTTPVVRNNVPIFKITIPLPHSPILLNETWSRRNHGLTDDLDNLNPNTFWAHHKRDFQFLPDTVRDLAWSEVQLNSLVLEHGDKSIHVVDLPPEMVE